MSEIYRCDVTGIVYEQDVLERFHVGPSNFEWFDFGPDATEEEIKSHASQILDDAVEAAVEMVDVGDGEAVKLQEEQR